MAQGSQALPLVLLALTMSLEAKAETSTEANVQQAVPFFHVSDIERSVRYYVDGLGFQMTKHWIDNGRLRWCWLQHGVAAIMLQQFRKEVAIPGCLRRKLEWA